MIGKLLGLVGGKWGVIAIVVASLTIAGLYAYIKYQSAVHGRETVELRANLRDARRDIEDRNRVINVMTDEREQFSNRVEALAALMIGMQGQIARNAQQRTVDYQGMIRPRPLPGQPADIASMEQAANQGMNGLFNQMKIDSIAKANNERNPNETN